MKCIVLAAGYATRLYPLTENFPKPLLVVGGKTILDWLLDDINEAGGVDEFFVVSNHKFAHHFEDWAAKKPYAVTVIDDGTITNETRLGAVRDMLLATKSMEKPEDVLVIAGDNLLDFSLKVFLDYAKKKNTSCVMRFFQPDKAKLLKSGVITIDETERIVKMTEKSPTPESNWCCPPFYYYTAEDEGKIGEALEFGCGADAPGSYVAWLCERSPVYAMEMPGKRYDIGDIVSYEAVKREYKGIIR